MYVVEAAVLSNLPVPVLLGCDMIGLMEILPWQSTQFQAVKRARQRTERAREKKKREKMEPSLIQDPASETGLGAPTTEGIEEIATEVSTSLMTEDYEVDITYFRLLGSDQNDSRRKEE